MSKKYSEFTETQKEAHRSCSLAYYHSHKEAVLIKNTAYRAANRDKRNTQKRLWRAKNPDKVKVMCLTAYSKKKALGLCQRCGKAPSSGKTFCVPCAAEVSAYKGKHGVRWYQRVHMWGEQGGHCMNNACEVEFANEMGGSIDHDHKTGKVRGMLCSSCNLGLGIFNDSPKLLRGIANYIEEVA